MKICNFCTGNIEKKLIQIEDEINIRLPQFTHSTRFEIPLTLIESKQNI